MVTNSSLHKTAAKAWDPVAYPKRRSRIAFLIFAAHVFVFAVLFGSLAGCKPHHEAPHLDELISAGPIQHVSQ